jgi:hypothetical protein
MFMEILRDNPWLIVIMLGVLVPLFGIVFGTLSSYFATVRKAEAEAALKQEMLQRGMSAEVIKMVIECTTPRKGRRSVPEAAIHERV